MMYWTPWDNVDQFEKLVCEYTGSDFAVAVDSCTNAIFLSIKCLQYHNAIETDFIECPRKTYISVPMQIIHCGYKIKFIEDDWSGQYQLNPLPVVDSAQQFNKNMYIKEQLICLSFQSKKTISIGRGGMILTDNRKYAEYLKAIRYDGRPTVMYNDMLKLQPTIGYHMYMTPEQAIRGIDQLYNCKDNNPIGPSAKGFKIDLSTLDCFKEHIYSE